MKPDRRNLDYFKACLLGGAIGDAMGAAIEFKSLQSIRQEFGDSGLTDYAPAYGREGAITDDTQMTLFTAEGLILSKVRPEYRATQDPALAIYHAYLRWLYTQNTQSQEKLIKAHGTCSVVDGILTGFKELYALRAPGNTCLAALESGKMGTMDQPINNSKGCGGVMRVAPVGLAISNSRQAFELGCRCAAITHGHPSGYLAAGALSAIIAEIISGASLTEAIDTALVVLTTYKDHEQCTAAVKNAITLSQRIKTPCFEDIETLGQGWIAEEALAIGLYCALMAGNDFKKGIVLSTNHSGDSDSTGAITGNLLGAIYGIDALPLKWIESLELQELIEEIAHDLYQHFAEST